MISGTSKAIVFLCVLLHILETVLFLKFSQHGLDDRFCECAKPTEYPPGARVVNGASANGNDFKWLASLFQYSKRRGTPFEIREEVVHFCTASGE